MSYVLERGKLPEAEVQVILEQILQALAFIHDKRLAHMDIKLDNILLDDDFNVNLIDFEFVVHEDDLENRMRKSSYIYRALLSIYLSRSRNTPIHIS